MLRPEVKRSGLSSASAAGQLAAAPVAPNGAASTASADSDTADIQSMSARLQQIRHYLRQAAALRRSVGGRQGRNLDSLMQQLAEQESQCAAALEACLRLDAGVDLAVERQSDGERGSEDEEQDDDQNGVNGAVDDDEDEDEKEQAAVAATERPTIESKLGRHPDTADTSQCGDGDVDRDSGEELEALRNQRDLLRRMLQPQSYLQQQQQHRQLPALPSQSEQSAAEAVLLARRLAELESRRVRLDRTLEELAALRAEASTTSTEVQAAAESASAGHTAGEAAQLLGAMETMQARLDRLRTVRDRLAGVRQLADDYRRSALLANDSATVESDVDVAQRELHQLVRERQRLVDLQTELERLHSAAGRDAAALANDTFDEDDDPNLEAGGGQEEEEEEEAAGNDAGNDSDSDGDGDDSATFPAGLEARERQRRAQIPTAAATPGVEAGLGSGAQVAVCLQQCCALLTAQQQQLHRLTEQVNNLQLRQQQPVYQNQSYPGYWWGFWGQHHPYQQLPQQQGKCGFCCSCSGQRLTVSANQATVGSQTDLTSAAAAESAESALAPAMSQSEAENSDAPQQGFDRLRESIYSEVAAVISQNESRPHFLVELFRELQLLSTDSLRQRALQQLQRLVNGYLASRPPWLRDSDDGSDVDGNRVDKKSAAAVVDVEQTPSESYATTSATGEAAGDAGAGRRRSSGSVSPFARDSLGDTAINLDRAMSQIRLQQQQQQHRQHLLSSSSSGGRAAVAAGASASGRIDAERLDRQVKSVVRHLIPALRTHAQEVATPQLLAWVADLALQRVQLFLDPTAGDDVSDAVSSAASSTSGRDAALSQDSEFDRFFARQLAGLLTDSLARFCGHRLVDCTEDMLVDLSELLFNELAFFRLVNNLDVNGDDDEGNDAVGDRQNKAADRFAAVDDTDSVATEEASGVEKGEGKGEENDGDSEEDKGDGEDANGDGEEDEGDGEDANGDGEEDEGDGEGSDAGTASAQPVDDYSDDFEEAANSSDAEKLPKVDQMPDGQQRDGEGEGETKQVSMTTVDKPNGDA